MRYEDLSKKQQEKINACDTPEQVLAFAKEEGIDLSDEQLDQISGGWGGVSDYCPNCHQRNYHTTGTGTDHMKYVCNNCSCIWG